MVIAALVSRYAPSSRGILRFNPRLNDAAAISASARDLRSTLSTRDLRYSAYSASQSMREVESSEEGQEQSRGICTLPAMLVENDPTITAFHRRKRFRAIAFLTSVASDFDVVSDWIFYIHALAKDNEYRSEAQDGSHLIPPFTLWLVLVFCVTGTLCWLTLATDGRLIMPIMKRYDIKGISTGHMLLLCLFFEDLPQVVLTFLVEDYYEEDGSLSNYAICNLMASLYDTLIKMAEAYDERHDVVETGVFCKKSFWAHKRCLSCVVAIPPSPSDALHQIADINDPSPPIRFITGSWDRTARFWDTSLRVTEKHREHCVRTYRGHKGKVTCVAILGRHVGYADIAHEHRGTFHEEAGDDQNIFFITGSKDGTVKMWRLGSDECIRTYSHDSPETKPDGRFVTSLACLDRTTGALFVCGYRDATARLWDAWTGECLQVYHGHSKCVTAICSMGDASTFVTGSEDETLKWWDTSLATIPLSSTDSDDRFNCSRQNSRVKEWETGLVVTKDAASAILEVELDEELRQTFVGHTDAVLSVAVVMNGMTIVSGSADRTARLWSLLDGSCLIILSGHSHFVSAVAALNEETILTGSHDKTAKIWDAPTGCCLRTYSGHSKYITSVTGCYDEGTFLTASSDQTVKLWAVTTAHVHPDSEFETSMRGFPQDR